MTLINSFLYLFFIIPIAGGMFHKFNHNNNKTCHKKVNLRIHGNQSPRKTITELVIYNICSFAYETALPIPGKAGQDIHTHSPKQHRYIALFYLIPISDI
jgi:hypothetical protein